MDRGPKGAVMTAPRYTPGDPVTVLDFHPPGHVRTPFFIRGRAGVVQSILGAFPNPEELAYGRDGTPAQTLYRVSFHQRDIWPDYNGPEKDTLVIDIYEHWLEPRA